MTINYADKSFFNKAWKAIDDNIEFEIIVSDWRCKIVAKAWQLYELTFIKDNRAIGNKVKFSVYGMVTPMLWGIINHALITEMNVNGSKTKDGFILKFSRVPK